MTKQEKADDGLHDYSVHMRAVVTRDVEIRAASPEEAVRLVTERRDRDGLGPIDLRPEWVEDMEGGHDVVGRCEACMAWLLSGRDEGQSVDDDGVMLCTPCVAKAVEAAREEGSQ